MTYQPNMIAAADQYAAAANELLDTALTKLRTDLARHGSRGVDVAELALIINEYAGHEDAVTMLAAALVRLTNQNTPSIVEGLRALEHDLRWHNQSEAADQVAAMIARHQGGVA
jgi:hypothetical protein